MVAKSQKAARYPPVARSLNGPRCSLPPAQSVPTEGNEIVEAKKGGSKKQSRALLLTAPLSPAQIVIAAGCWHNRHCRPNLACFRGCCTSGCIQQVWDRAAHCHCSMQLLHLLVAVS